MKKTITIDISHPTQKVTIDGAEYVISLSKVTYQLGIVNYNTNQDEAVRIFGQVMKGVSKQEIEALVHHPTKRLVLEDLSFGEASFIQDLLETNNIDSKITENHEKSNQQGEKSP